ncbi:MAG: GNAT family N-acetyltransferase [Tolumonas sp.]|nr:GNAT family N-acetyltransferase [Tolumonas sp.]
MMPPLFTRRLCLQPLVLQDVVAIREITSDPIFIQASHHCLMPTSDNQLLRWAIEQQKQHQNGKGCCYAIRDIKEKALIGLVTLQSETEHVELSYWLSSPYWRQGLMTEAVSCVLNEWQRTYPQVTVYSNCNINNLASIALLQKMGMQMMNTEDKNETRAFILVG